MAEVFLGEIRFFAYSKIPAGWLPCQGQVMQITQYAALFSLLGTAYGGDGTSTFQLPDLRGTVPLGMSPDYPAGKKGGEAVHPLAVNEMPAHTHQATGSTKGPSVTSPKDNTWAAVATAYAPTANTTMAAQALSSAGASAPHSNMQPYLTLSPCIAIQGIYPPRP